MNFHVYLDEDLGRQVQQICHTTHKKRNTIIREALHLYIQQQKSAVWPDSVLSFQGISDFPSFESMRDEFPLDKRPSFLD